MGNDEIYQVLVEQMECFIPSTYDASRTVWNSQCEFHTPFGSAVLNDCIKNGKDVSEGGARYPFGDGVCYAVAIDLAHALAAIKKAVFDDRKITVQQLKEVLASDFKGYDDIERIARRHQNGEKLGKL